MPKHTAVFCLSLLVCGQAMLGCHKDKPAVLASKANVVQGAATKARTMLDMLEKLEPEKRQKLANSLRMAATLKTASADPTTKARMDSLGIQVPP